MTPELEQELWEKLVRWIRRNPGRRVEITGHALGGLEFRALDTGSDTVLHSATGNPHTDALRRFIGKLQGNRS